MVAQCLPRPVLRWVNFFDDAGARIDPVDYAGGHQGCMPIWDDVEFVLLNQC